MAVAERIPRWIGAERTGAGPKLGTTIVRLSAITAIESINNGRCLVRAGGEWFGVDQSADAVRKAVDEVE